MNALAGIGGPYAVAAALLIYAIEKPILDAALQLPSLAAMIGTGLLLAFVNAFRSKSI